MISPDASNWVDRGDPPEPKLARTLHHFLGRDLPLDDEALLGYAGTVLAMVDADGWLRESILRGESY